MEFSQVQDVGPLELTWHTRAASLLNCTVAAFAGAMALRLALGRASVGAAVWEVGGALFVAFLGHGILSRQAYASRRRALQSIRYRACPWCNCDLRPSPPIGKCPDCREPFTPASLEHDWQELLERF